MRDLSEIREDINAIDSEMGKLFDRRMNLAKEVAAFKEEKNLPIFDAEREKIVLESRLKDFPNRDDEFLKELSCFYQTMMDLSKQEQKRAMKKELPIGFYGVPGSFTQEAFLTMFGKETKGVSYQTFRDIFEAVRKEEVAMAVVALENSLTGIIDDVYDLMSEYGFYIAKECVIRIRQNLMGTMDSSLEDIKEVYSHPQGFAQSSEFLSSYPNWQLIPYYNTSKSAALVSQTKDKTKACICGMTNKELYGLKVLCPDIQDNKENFTRFAVISPNMKIDKDADTISLHFTLEHRPGSLYAVLEEFSKHHLNLLRIDSRPIKGKIWEYAFFVDIEGNLENEEVKQGLKGVREHCLSWRVLGNYRKP